MNVNPLDWTLDKNSDENLVNDDVSGCRLNDLMLYVYKTFRIQLKKIIIITIIELAFRRCENLFQNTINTTT